MLLLRPLCVHVLVLVVVAAFVQVFRLHRTVRVFVLAVVLVVVFVWLVVAAVCAAV